MDYDKMIEQLRYLADTPSYTAFHDAKEREIICDQCEADFCYDKQQDAHWCMYEALSRAATALSALQAENEEMQKQLNEFSEFLCHMTGGLLSKTNYTAQEMISAAEDYQQKVCGECDLRAENEKLRAELESLKKEHCAGCSVPVVEVERLRDLNDAPKLRAELEAAQAALAELTGLAGGSVQTLFGVPLERMRELAQAELEGRIMLRSAGSGKKCGSCVHWHRISETKRGTCDVRQWERNRRGHMEPWRHSFTPAQSYGACRYYISGEDSANG